MRATPDLQKCPAEAVVLDRSTLRGKALVPTLVFLVLLTSVVSSVGAPLVPGIGVDYDVAVGTAQWSLTITFLVGALSAPIIGRLADGPRRLHVLLGALGALIIGCAVAAIPGPFAMLITGRALQGVGLALLPLVMSVARDHLDPERARTTLATLSVTAVVGVGIGYPFTGLIADQWGLHACFWVAGALGVGAFALSLLVIPTSKHRESHHFDLAGATLMAIGLSALLLCISEGESWGWGSPRMLGLAALAVAVLAIWIVQQLHGHHPLVDLRLMRVRPVLTANVVGLIAGVGMYIMMSMVIRFVQTPESTGYGLGESAVVAGLVLVPMSIASFSASKVTTHLARWLRPARILPIGALMFAFALGLFATRREHLWEIFVVMAFVGLGVGCSFAVMPRLIVPAVPPEQTGSALALNQVLRTIGMSIGSALSAAILAAHTIAPDPFPTNAGYTIGAVVAIGLCMAMGVVSIALTPRLKGAELSAAQELLVEESVDSALSGVIEFEPDEAQLDRTANRDARPDAPRSVQPTGIPR
ncbi:MAG: transporter [Pseudonocardiales bacterium]|nr:transporter [Pseudonocardiales bacterium]